MGLLTTFRYLAAHPFASRQRWRTLKRYARWQVGSRILGAPVLHPLANGTRMVVRIGMKGATANVYAGLQDFADMGFVLHALRPGDLFVDVGANVGAYTLLAASVGAACEAFEPVPATHAALRDNLRVNDFPIPVRAHQTAIGSAPGTVAFTAGREDTVNHVVLDRHAEAGDVIEVPVAALDMVLRPAEWTLIKIDVEGFEAEVIEGGAKILADARTKGVIMEMNGSGARYGVSDRDLHARMLAFGFVACRYDPYRRTLDRADGPDAEGNALYVRDVPAMQERLRGAPRFDVLGHRI